MSKIIPTMVVALDLGPGSERVAAYAGDLAQTTGARVVALHVVVGLEDILNVEFPYIAYEEDFVALDAKARTSLERLVAKTMRGAQDVKLVIADGKPAKEILRVAAEEHADLIVAGTRDGSKVERAIYGSPALQLAQKTPVPLLLVPTRSPPPT